MKPKSFTDLDVYKEARKFRKMIFQKTKIYFNWDSKRYENTTWSLFTIVKRLHEIFKE